VTGPEHYQRAERLSNDGLSIEAAIHATQDDKQRAALDSQARRVLARAQVHATLALAAAHALMGEATDQRWWRVAAPVNESGGPA
jgi:hypothetical protein